MTSLITPKVDRKDGGMPKRAFLRPYYSRIDGKPFLSRFIFWFTPKSGCHVTWIRQADNQREWPHDHTATFKTLILSGSYEESVYSGDPANPVKTHRKHRWLSRMELRWDQAHSITSISRWPLVTLLTLGERCNSSSYWTPKGKEALGMPADEWS
jgi:hypothetical protein